MKGGASQTRDSPINTLLSGATAGVVSDVLTHPISTAKARLQTQRVTIGQPLMYKGTFDALAKIMRNEGLLKPYAGIGTVAAAAPARAMYFAGYELAKSQGARMSGSDDNPLVHFLAGPFAQLSGSLMWVPMDVVKERMQVSTSGQFTNSLNAAVQIVRTEGVRGLFRGYIAHQLVWGPYNGFYFSAYEFAKRNFHAVMSSDPSSALPNYAFPICASLAATFAGTITAPLDTVKVRLQTQGNSGQYSSSVDCARKMIRHEGFSSLFRGVGARVIWLSINHAISMSVYEHTQAWLQARNRNAVAVASE